MEFEGKTILVAPLDWGLGHASRCVQLIRQLSGKNKVIIGVTSENVSLLRVYFPDHENVELPSYKITYSKSTPQWLALIRRLPTILHVIRDERRVTDKLVRNHKAEVLISDNRYGVYHKTTTNIFVCHQVNLQLPFCSRLLNRLHKQFIKNFTEVWIPDYADQKLRLAGKLSDASSLNIKCRYIGPLSALSGKSVVHDTTYDYLFLLSGPEPQRSMLEKKLLGLMDGKNFRIALVRGTTKPLANVFKTAFRIDICSGDELIRLIQTSRVVICRSGYSTLMDLHRLGKKEVVLVPTPGQPEQEYLAKHWQENFGAKVVTQKKLNLAALTSIESLRDSNAVEG